MPSLEQRIDEIAEGLANEYSGGACYWYAKPLVVDEAKQAILAAVEGCLPTEWDKSTWATKDYWAGYQAAIDQTRANIGEK